jgi:prephenate dehydratase
MAKKVGFQGVPGAYSEIAARTFFGPSVNTVAFKTFAEVFNAVSKGVVNSGILPLENSLAGSIHQNYDLLLKHKVAIIGEIKLRVSHNLIAHPQAKLSDILHIYSHPQALAQCSLFIKKMRQSEEVPYFDTAGSAQFVKETNLKQNAAIASAQAAKLYGLKILKAGIEDDKKNYTRFAVINKKPLAAKGNAARNKISLVFALKNIPGGLHKALGAFASRDIDLLKIESRPLAGSPWKYLFYLDVKGSLGDEPCRKALKHLSEIAKFQRILGCYPIARD